MPTTKIDFDQDSFLRMCEKAAALEIRDRALDREFQSLWFHSLLLLLALVFVARGLLI